MVMQAALRRYWIRSSREVAGRGDWWLAMGITFVGGRCVVYKLVDRSSIYFVGLHERS